MTDERRSGPDARRPEGELPRAVLRGERRFPWVWVVPALALVVAGWLALDAWQRRGTAVVVQFPEGHGLAVGAPLRYRGITVGEVRDLALDEGEGGDGGVMATIALHEQADRLARSGARFWIVRPRVRLTEVEGLETLVGPRYVAVLPGPHDGRRQRRFVALSAAPAIEHVEPGDLEIVLEAVRLGSLREGAPVSYRQVPVGTVLSVGLASDGSRVEARLHVGKAYRGLIRAGTRLWDSGGLRAHIGLTGGEIEIDSLSRLVTGGVALATPPPEKAGEAVHTGHRFVLAEEPEDAWLEWRPLVAIGSSLLPAGAPAPQPQRAALGWTEGLLFKGSKVRRGWVLQTARGLLGPADLLRPGDKADSGTGALEVAGRAVPLEEGPAWEGEGLALLDVRVSDAAWPETLIRRAEAPEDCVAIADQADEPIPLAASRLAPDGSGWRVDPAISADAAWHGACVLSRDDGCLVGLLLVDGDRLRVALVPGAW